MYRETNCVTELLPERAFARAQELDEYFEEHKKPRGPLHGLPISVKEHVGMEGLGLNTGLVAWADKKADEDALLLQILWQAGCVFYVRTTEPQTLVCTHDCSLIPMRINWHNPSLLLLSIVALKPMTNPSKQAI